MQVFEVLTYDVDGNVIEFTIHSTCKKKYDKALKVLKRMNKQNVVKVHKLMFQDLFVYKLGTDPGILFS
jgi:hypothetical protein